MEDDIHTHEGRILRITRWSIFSFYAKHHAKHGGGFRGQGRKISWSKIITVAKDAYDSSSMLSTMLKYGGGRATLHYEHREGR